MKNHTKLILLLVIALVGVTQIYRSEAESSIGLAHARLLATLDPSRVITGTTRTQNVLTYCGSTPRASLITDTEIATAAGYFSTLKMYFNVDAIQFISAAMTFNIPAIMAQGQQVIIGLGIYVVPFVIGLVLSLTLWTCLCCCCTCPGCCPSKCCQHDENLLYTKCEMLWPVIFLMIVLLLACAAAVPGILFFNAGITRASTLSDSIKTMQCGVSLTFDDLINGNITSDNSTFFMGAKTLQNYLLDFKGNISNIINNFTTNLQTDVSNLNGNLTQGKTDIIALPTNTNTNNSYSLIYTNPTASGGGSVTSSFSQVLGTANASSTLTGILFTIVDQLSTVISAMNTAITSLSSASGTITTGIQSASDSIGGYADLIAGVDIGLTGTFATVSPYLEYLRYAFLGYYGAVIGLSVLALLGAIIMACFDKPGCRHLMYVSCVVMFLICIVGFLLSFLLSVIIPILYMGCSVVSPALDSSATFLNTTATLNLPSSITSIAAVCLPGGGGQILNQFGTTVSDINTQIANVQLMMNNMNIYQNYDLTGISNASTAILNTMNDFIEARQNDIIQDATSLDWFKKIANGSFPASCSANAAFQADSLVPSGDSKSTGTVPCKSGTSAVANGSCSGANFGVIGTCTAGCIDMANVMSTAASKANLLTYLTNRYGAGACATDLGTEFGNNYDFWYTPRVDGTTGINSVKTRFNGAVTTDLNNINSDMTALKPKFRDVYGNLSAAINSLVDPNYGMVAGVNCLLIGEDLKTTKNTLCVSLFNSLYFLFMTVGTASFALLFSMCCIVCSGVRHLKQSQKKSGKAIPEGSSLGFNNSMNQGMPMHHMPAKGGYY